MNRNPSILSITVFLCLTGFLINAYAQESTFEIVAGEDRYSLNQYLLIWEDTAGNIKINEIIGKDSLFRPFDPEEKLDRNGTYWGKLTLLNHTEYPGKWVLSPDWGRSVKRNSFVEIYILPGNEVKKTGRLLPYSQKEGVAKRAANNQVLLELDSNEQIDLYMKIWQIDYKRPVFDVQLMEYAYWRGEKDEESNIIQAIFQGIVWIMIFYSIVTFWSLKDTTYLYYALFVFSTSLYFLFVSGILSETLFREYPILSFYVWIFAINLLAIGYFQFARSFLNTKKLMPFWDKMGRKAISGLMILAVIEVFFLYFTLNQAYLNHFNNFIIFAEITFLLVICLSYIKAAYGLTRIFFWGTLCLIVAGFVGIFLELIGEAQRFLPLIEFFFVLEIITFSWGLGYRHYIHKKQRLIKKSEAENLKKLNQMKSHFFANISHEFRTPLTVLMGTAQNLREAWPRLAKDAIEKRLNSIYRNGATLLKLVNQILELTKLESRTLQMNWQYGDIIGFIKYLMEPFSTYTQARNIKLTFSSEEDEINMDFEPESIQSILSNLLSNAVKFTPDGGSIRVSVKSVRKNGKYLELEVTDSGQGIPAEDIPLIFDRYFQSGSSVSKSVGTGIGLALVKEQVGLLNGDIIVESEEGQGTCFRIHLPITDKASGRQHAPFFPDIDSDLWLNLESPASVAAVSAEQPKIEISDFERNYILIIDDNPDIIDYLKLVLSDKYRIAVARNGAEGIHLASEIIPDLIISDIMMPEKDGYEVCQTLKNDRRTSHIPIILLTARAGQEDRVEGFKQGADAYLVKPFQQEELLVRIQQLIDQRTKLQERFSSGKSDSQDTHREKEDAFIKEARRLVEANLDNEAFTPEALCKIIGMSYTQFYRKLKALTNLTISLFIREIRLEKAHRLLQTSGLNVSEVAYEVGFKDPAYFSRVFVKKYGIPPINLLP